MVRDARFTLEDHAYGTSRLPKTTVLQFRVVQRRWSTAANFDTKKLRNMTLGYREIRELNIKSFLIDVVLSVTVVAS